MKNIHTITTILIILGGLNWGLIGVININIIASIFSELPIIKNIIYSLIGLAAIYQLIDLLGIYEYMHD